MSTKVNFTDRLDLSSENVASKLLINPAVSGAYEISILADLRFLKIPGPFKVVLIHKALGETRRFESVDQSDLLIDVRHSLEDMRNPLEVVSQLEIVQKDASNVPVIRAMIRNINPELPGKQSATKSALKTKRDPDLNVPWRLSYSEGYPILHVTDKNGLYDQLFLTPQFDPLILPEVVRQVFVWLVFDPSEKDSFHVDAWKSIFEQLGCERAFFDAFSVPNEEDGYMEGMTPSLRAQVLAMSCDVSDRLANDLDLLNRLSQAEKGEE
jgi:hypothetical protein